MPEETSERPRKEIPINPNDDIDVIEKNLKQAREKLTLSAEELGYQLDIVRTVKPFWKYVTPTMLHGAVASGAAYISGWRDQAEYWNGQSQDLYSQVVVVSGTAASTMALDIQSLINSLGNL